MTKIEWGRVAELARDDERRLYIFIHVTAVAMVLYTESIVISHSSIVLCECENAVMEHARR